MAIDPNNKPSGKFARTYHRLFSLGALKPHAKTLLPFLDKKGGKFVEIGARDGLTESFTPFLEKGLGWSGLLVEPWPHLFRKCRKNRRASLCLNVAAVGKQLQDGVIEVEGLPPRASIRQSVAREIEKRSQASKALVAPPPSQSRKVVNYVSTNPLANILEKAEMDQSFDLLVLNLLGQEVSALEGMDFGKYKPTFLLIRTGENKLALPHLPHYYERVVGTRHSDSTFLCLFRFADFGAN